MQEDPKQPKKGHPQDEDLPGYPEYPKEEDIYNREEEESFEDSDDPEARAVDGEEISMDDNLDVPGAELDDADEEIGEEDEENNYYSLGGDGHDDPKPEK